MQNLLPSFFIVGAMKSGTTSLYQYLSQHPNIFMSPIKEPHFFAFQGKSPIFNGPKDQEIINKMVSTNLKEYQNLFTGRNLEKKIGEASAMYLYYPHVAKQIKKSIPDAKIIIILRNPVTRAYSSFKHLIRDNREPIPDFSNALKEEKCRIKNNWSPIWHYIKAGFYFQQLSIYLDTFPTNQFRIYIFEEFINDPQKILSDIYDFLDVNDYILPNNFKSYNVSGLPRSKFIHQIDGFLIGNHPIKEKIGLLFSPKIRSLVNKWAINFIRKKHLINPELNSELKRELADIFIEDIQKTSLLIDKDLSNWLKV